ncbi:MAG: hypothetical protein KKE59_04510 [Proteobacteria bacterium]|nr:hypothetical protein [Pseudomonadota bacterium]
MVKVVQYKKNKLLSGRRSSSTDRRRLDNRRRVYSLDYFSQGGIERRKTQDRRKRRHDRRKGWVRVGDWSSIFIDPDSNTDSL